MCVVLQLIYKNTKKVLTKTFFLRLNLQKTKSSFFNQQCNIIWQMFWIKTKVLEERKDTFLTFLQKLSDLSVK